MVKNRLVVSFMAGMLLLGGAGCTSSGQEKTAADAPAASAPSEKVDLSVPSLKMTNHLLTKEDVFTIDEIVSMEDGWVAIVNEINARPLEVIGYAPVKIGLNTNVKVKISRNDATAQEYVFLLVDRSTIGKFDGLEDEDYVTDAAGKKVSYKFFVEVE